MSKESAENCVFCKILKGEIEASFVYEDEEVVAFLDIEPVNEGHVLVIPRVHVPHLNDLNDETLGHMAKVAGKITKAIRKSDVRSEGMNLFLSDDEAAGQDVWHAHLHVFPRFKDDGFGLKHDPKKNHLHPPRAKLNELAEKLKKYL